MNILQDRNDYRDKKIHITDNSCLKNEENFEIKSLDNSKITHNFNLNIVNQGNHNEMSISKEENHFNN